MASPVAAAAYWTGGWVERGTPPVPPSLSGPGVAAPLGASHSSASTLVSAAALGVTNGSASSSSSLPMDSYQHSSARAPESAEINSSLHALKDRVALATSPPRSPPPPPRQPADASASSPAATDSGSLLLGLPCFPATGAVGGSQEGLLRQCQQRCEAEEAALQHSERKTVLLSQLLHGAKTSIECLGEEADSQCQQLQQELDGKQAELDDVLCELRTLGKAGGPGGGGGGAPWRARLGGCEAECRLLEEDAGSLRNEARALRECEEASWCRQSASHVELAADVAELRRSVELGRRRLPEEASEEAEAWVALASSAEERALTQEAVMSAECSRETEACGVLRREGEERQAELRCWFQEEEDVRLRRCAQAAEVRITGLRAAYVEELAVAAAGCRRAEAERADELRAAVGDREAAAERSAAEADACAACRRELAAAAGAARRREEELATASPRRDADAAAGLERVELQARWHCMAIACLREDSARQLGRCRAAWSSGARRRRASVAGLEEQVCALSVGATLAQEVERHCEAGERRLANVEQRFLSQAKDAGNATQLIGSELQEAQVSFHAQLAHLSAELQEEEDGRRREEAHAIRLRSEIVARTDDVDAKLLRLDGALREERAEVARLRHELAEAEAAIGMLVVQGEGVGGHV